MLHVEALNQYHESRHILRERRVLAEGSMETVQNNPEVIEVYLGD